METKLLYKSGYINNLKLRMIYGSILAPLMLFVIYTGGVLYNAVIVIIAILMSNEWNNIISTKKHKKLELFMWRMIGFVYISVSSMSMLLVNSNAIVCNTVVTFWLFSNVWVTDIAAFFVGNAVGGPKLCPKISPNKTWSGFFGGLLSAGIIGVAFYPFLLCYDIKFISLEFNKIVIFSVFSMLVSVISQLGDMFESFIKRKFKVKDSGSIIPGHGGVLDRLDGMLFAAPAVFLVTYILSH